MVNLRTSLALIALAMFASLPHASIAANPVAIADSLFVAGHLTAAQEWYTRAHDETPSDVHVTRRLGELALYTNNLDDARTYLGIVQHQDPDDSASGKFLAELFYRRDQYDSAAIYMERFGRDAVAKKLASFKGQTPYEVRNAPDVARVHFVQTDPLPIMRAKVNGSDSALFILDTGAHEVYLDPDFAERVGVDILGTTTGTFAGGKTADVGHGVVDSLTLGELTVYNVPVVTLPTKKFEAVTGGQPVSGVLGTALLYHFLSTIDYPNGELVFRKRGSDAAREYRQTLASSAQSDQFWLAGTHFMLANGFLNDADTALMFMDTGLAGAAFTGPDRTFAAAGIVGDNANAAEGMGGGGKVRVVPVTIDRITLGSVTRTDQIGIMGIFPGVIEANTGIRVGGIVSHAFFRPYALTFDFDGMRYYLSQ